MSMYFKPGKFRKALPKASTSFKNRSFKILPVLFLIHFYGMVSAQGNTDAATRFFRGTATLTSKGLSTFPNLTLGKPAAILDLSMGGETFRFDPTLRFGLDGKPWSFIFWLRYQAVKNEKFGLRFGAHPAYTFKTVPVTQNGNTNNILRTQQYLACEIAPVFNIIKNISIGPYYIFSRGIDKEAVQYSNYITLMANFSSINLGDKTFLRLMAQTYYLKMDKNDGFYVNSTLSLNRRNFPFSVSSTINKAIDSTLPGDSFLWNINLIYAFGGNYIKN